MYNTDIFNSVPLNTWSPFANDLISDDIIFNWFWFQNENVVTSFKDDQNLPEIELNSFQNPIIDGGAVLNRRFASKNITLKGVLKTATASEMETLIDTFKQKTTAVEGFLDIKINGEYRRTKATCIKSDVFQRRNFDITRCPFEITFQTLDPFFYLKTKETYFEQNVSADLNIDLAYYWNASAYPKIYMFFAWSIVWTDTISVELNWRKIDFVQSISDFDVLIIDCIDKQVTLNWNIIDYNWSFPFLEYWSNVFDININWTFVCDISILYPKNYL